MGPSLGRAHGSRDRRLLNRSPREVSGTVGGNEGRGVDREQGREPGKGLKT